MDPIDETVLADFLAGHLTPDRRAEVIRHLAANESSRELLGMAYRALEASRTGAEAGRIHAMPSLEGDRAHADAVPAQPRFYTLRNVSRLAAVVALLLGATAVLRLVLETPADHVRNVEVEAPLVLEARISPQTLAIAWNAVPGADRYEVLVWDQEAAREVAFEQVRATRLPAEDAFAALLRERMNTGHVYALQVTAFDATNRRLAASELTTFRYDG